MTRMTPDLYDRRKKMLELHYNGIPHRTILKEISTEFGVSYNACKQDWKRRNEWQSLIWRMATDHSKVNELLFTIQLVKERALRLSATAPGGNAKVGALRVLVDTVFREIEVRQSLGQLPRVAERVEMKDTTEAISLDFDATDEERAILNRAAHILDSKMAEKSEHRKLH